MTFDEQLKRAFDTLSDRLRDEMSRQVGSIADELAATARERERAADEARARAIDDARQQAFEDARARALKDQQQAVDEARERALAEGREAASADAQRELESARARAREEGREQALEEIRQRAEQEPDAAHVFERVCDSIRALDRARTLGEVLDTLASCAGREAARVGVVVVRGAGVQTWRLIGFGALDDGGTFEAAAADPEIMSDACREAAVQLRGHRIAVPLSVGGTVVAALYADSGESNPDTRIPNHVLEILARHAARVLESMTAFKAARAMLAQPGASASPASAASDAFASSGDDEAARRYARLLVSEIKLYHEPDVLAGRRDRDLMSRLGGEIARARSLYEQRVAAPIRQRTDYFDDELVRTLADGDATLLQLT